MVRIGDTTHDATTAAPGVALPVYLDEVNPTFPFLPLATVTLSKSLCTLGRGKATAAPWVWWETVSRA